MARRSTGIYERITVGGEEVAAFLPHPLPPAEPPLELEGALRERPVAAEQALQRLDPLRSPGAGPPGCRAHADETRSGKGSAAVCGWW
jgi:hypothetical protein